MTAGRWRELVLLAAILALAAALRLPGLDERGRWDADQGHDMLVLRAMVVRGEVPLLGPRTSIGTFHHGAAYYYLLAPAAFLGNADPVVVTGEIALIGVAAVAAVWWLARMLGGRAAGLAAATIAAISPAGIDESTFIWNPNVIPLASALALGGAVRAWQTRRPRWWVLAAVGSMVTMQAHVLGVAMLPPLVGLFAADAWRRRGGRAPLRPLVGAGVAGALIIAAGYVPLAIHELTHDFGETRAILDYVAAGGSGSDLGFATRLAMVALRSIVWPLAGLITDRPPVSIAAVVIAVVLIGAAVLGRRAGGRRADGGESGGGESGGGESGGGESGGGQSGGLDAAGGVESGGPEAPGGHGARQRLAWWLVATLAWSAIALALFAPSLAVVTPGLPNDHYHAFLDPIVLALAGVGLAAVAGLGSGTAALPDATGRTAAPSRGAAMAGQVAAVVLAGGLGAAAVLGWPPAVSDDGGWRGVDAAAARLVGSVGTGPGAWLVGIPPFKSADALRFPLERRGLVPANTDPVSGEGGGAGDGEGGGADDRDPGGAGGAGDTGVRSTTIVVCDPLFDEVVGAPCGGPAEAAWAAASAPGSRVVERFDAGSRRVISVYEPASP